LKNEVNVDAIYQGAPIGPVANAITGAGGMLDIGRMRPYVDSKGRPRFVATTNQRDEKGNRIVIPRPAFNAVLRKDEWKEYDTVVREAALERLTAVEDLESRNLTHNISNGFGKTVLEYEDESELQDAQISMDGLTRGQNDRPEYTMKYLPLPIVHKDFHINARVLEASRTTGAPLDTGTAEKASRKCAEYLENMVMNGPGSSTYAFGGGTVYGYTNFPQRITGSLTDNWDDMKDNSLGSPGEQIIADVLTMRQASIDALHRGPWMLYIPTNYEKTIDEDYVTGYPKTIRQRIKEIGGIEDVKVSDKLAADNVVLVQMSTDVVRLVTGMPMTTIQWGVEGNMSFNFKVMVIKVPQLRADDNGNTGIVHYS